MYEVSQKFPFKWDTEVTVIVTLKELAIIYSMFASSSTSDAERNVKRCFTEELDVLTDDPAYKIYDDAREILKNNGVVAIG